MLVTLMKRSLLFHQFRQLSQNYRRRHRSTAQIEGAIAGKLDDAAHFTRVLVQKGRPTHPRSHLSLLKLDQRRHIAGQAFTVSRHRTAIVKVLIGIAKEI
ncbi:MAG TPA: hypothetical protein V6D11_01560 [Waterburya sp.]